LIVHDAVARALPFLFAAVTVTEWAPTARFE
jgi:hypothetical protein